MQLRATFGTLVDVLRGQSGLFFQMLLHGKRSNQTHEDIVRLVDQPII
jgi:hypothetical protein